jgi:gamma-glutamylcyclotransferase (GGCT)/AIG2-like uncharacterized protein YtfP
MKINSLFVYGSLLSELENHHLLIDCELVCEDKIVANMFTLYSGWPFISLSNASMLVVGEIYIINEYNLKMIDKLEGYEDKSFNCLFNRKIVRTFKNNIVYVYEGGESLQKNENKVLIEHGDWRHYKQQYLFFQD